MQASQIENEARRDIFLKLCRAECLKYSELKPRGMESNHFSYHLKKLLEDGYILKSDKGLYSLGPKGLRLAGQISFRLEGLREQPKVIVLVRVISSDKTRQLVLKRNRQPHIGKLTIPGGKVHFGESMEAAANRMLKEFLESSIITPSYMGSFSLKFKSAKSYYSHIVGFVYNVELTDKKEEKISANLSRTDEVFWSKIGGESWEDWQSGSQEIIEAIDCGSLFNLELSYDD